MIINRQWLGFLLSLFSLEFIYQSGLTVNTVLVLLTALLAWHSQIVFKDKNIILLFLPVFYLFYFLETLGAPSFSLLLITALALSLFNSESNTVQRETPHQGNAVRFFLGAMGPLFIITLPYENKEHFIMAAVSCTVTALVFLRERYLTAKKALNAVSLGAFFFLSQLTIPSLLLGEWLLAIAIMICCVGFLRETDASGEKEGGF